MVGHRQGRYRISALVVLPSPQKIVRSSAKSRSNAATSLWSIATLRASSIFRTCSAAAEDSDGDGSQYAKSAEQPNASTPTVTTTRRVVHVGLTTASSATAEGWRDGCGKAVGGEGGGSSRRDRPEPFAAAHG
jgi:hypothetical protein